MTNPLEIHSQRLGTITGSQLQAALDRFMLGTLVHADPIVLGNFGQNIFLTSSAGEFVLRGWPLVPGQFETEQFFVDQLHERTAVPVPWPYLLDEDTDIFGWCYVLMPRMPGLQLEDRAVRSALHPADRLAIAEALGTALAALHELTWPVVGSYDHETARIQAFDQPYAARLADEIALRLARARARTDRTTAADIAWVQHLIEQAQAALTAPFVPTMVMADYREANVVVQQVDRTWRVSGVFDLMNAHFGDPDNDLPRAIADYLDREAACAVPFARAYRTARPLRPGFAERFRFYMLYDRVVIWDFAYGWNGPWWDPALTLRQWIEPFLDTVELFD